MRQAPRLGARGLLLTLALNGVDLAPARAAPASPTPPRAPVDATRAPRRAALLREVARLEQQSEQSPDDADVLFALGSAQARLGHRAEALLAYRRVISLQPRRPEAYLAYVDLLVEEPQRVHRGAAASVASEHRDAVLALLQGGLSRLARDPHGHAQLTIALAVYERALGKAQAARARLVALDQPGAPADLTPAERRRVAELLARLSTEEQTRELLDWPEPTVSAAARAELTQAEAALSRQDFTAALAQANRLWQREPALRALPALRWLRARALSALTRYDEAERELTVLVHLAPSFAPAWRLLGRTLVRHGGALDAERADQALRQALALDPGAFDLWRLRAEVALRRGRSADAARHLNRYLREDPAPDRDPEVQRLRESLSAQERLTSPSAGRPRPEAPAVSTFARDKLREAREWLDTGDPAGMAGDLLSAALTDSPGFVEAAATSYGLTGVMPERTVQVLWGHGEALLELARRIRALPRPTPAPPSEAPRPADHRGPAAAPITEDHRALLRRLLDRAVALDVAEARFERGLLRSEDNDREGGLFDLRAYVASEPQAPGLDEARGVLAARGDEPPQAALLARVYLLQEHPTEAAEVLGGRCEATTRGERLLPLGTVHEWAGAPARALSCYREALRRDPAALAPLARLASLAARAPLSLAAQVEPELQRAAGRGVLPAEWALARLHLSRGQSAAALPRLQRYLSATPPAGEDDDPGRAAAYPALQALLQANAAAQAAVWQRRLLGGVGALTLLVLTLLWLLRGVRLTRALARRPSLFPEVARVISDLRHDVLKHRTSALPLCASGAAPLAQVAAVLWEPGRTSDAIAAAYERLRVAARGQGLTLRSLAREPLFGRLWRDLRTAEVLVREGREGREPLSPRRRLALQRLAARLPAHSEALGALLQSGPRTPLTATLLSGWIHDTEAALRVRGARWTPPGLSLSALELAFPLSQAALCALFVNLLRNAQAAVAQAPGAQILIRVAAERDETGRRVLVLLVCDSAPAPLTLETIEARESGRGLAIVRDLVHEWRGNLLLRPQAAPLAKGVGACFPA